MKVARIMVAFAMMLAIAGCLGAQDYPSKPVKVVITFTEGSATDFVGRTICEKLSEIWGQEVAVENLAGAGGTIGAAAVAEAPPDGYTLLVHSSAYAVNPTLNAGLPYDPLKAFVDIAPLAKQPMALVVGPAAEVRSVSEIVALAKAQPGTVTFGSSGTGSAAHLAGEKFKSEAGIDVVHVPFKGGPETIAATGDGRVLYSLLPISLALKGVKSGKLVPLAVTSLERSQALPDVPTLKEEGFATTESTVWWGIWAPSGTPESVLAKLRQDVGGALGDPEVREKFQNKAFEPLSMTSGEFAQFVRDEINSVAALAKEAGLEPK